MHIGIDFGTTNSSLAAADAQGHVTLITFPWREALTESFRSLLYLGALEGRHAQHYQIVGRPVRH